MSEVTLSETPSPVKMKISEIRIGKRFRKDMGDMDYLKSSITKIGLMHSIPVTPKGFLIAGRRRLAACEKLGWDEIPVTIVRGMGDAIKALTAERDENLCREPMKNSELVALGDRLLELEKAEAKKRQGKKQPEGSMKGRADDKVAKALDVSAPTYRKARELVKKKDEDPEKYGALVEEMDGTGKVNGAYKKAKRIEKGLPPEESLEDKLTAKFKELTRTLVGLNDDLGGWVAVRNSLKKPKKFYQEVMRPFIEQAADIETSFTPEEDE